ncbi:hypothetical protein FB451DRAFT_1534349 [Mycena latifolia]|nr:hypothetical protein FB451DRAFT_1534349 [Mycena latifolia]
MQNEIPRSQTPHPAHSEDDTCTALRELQLAAVDRDSQAQVARLTVHLQHALEHTGRARARNQKRWRCIPPGEGVRKNDSECGAGEEHDSNPSRSPEQACPSDSIPAQADRDPRKRIKLDSTTASASLSSAPPSTAAPPRPVPTPLLPSRPRELSVPPNAQAAHGHRAAVTPMSTLKPTQERRSQTFQLQRPSPSTGEHRSPILKGSGDNRWLRLALA